MALTKGFRFTIVCMVFMFFFGVQVKANVITIGFDTFYENQVNLFVNDVLLDELPMKPVFYNDYLLVPSREVFETIGAYVHYQAEDNTIYIIYKSHLISMNPDNKTAVIDNKEVTMPIAPKIVNDKLMIPLRAVSENFGLGVNWINATRSAYINEKIEYQPIPNTDVPTETDVVDTLYPNDVNNAIPDDSNHSQVYEGLTITEMTIPAQGEKQSYVIKLNNKIEQFEYNILNDNRLIIDFYGTFSALDPDYYINSNKVNSIRTGTEPAGNGKTKTRIVFDLVSKDDVFINVSEDRKSVLIDLDENYKPSNQVANNDITVKNSVIKVSKQNYNININDIIKFDDYSNLKYTIVFPCRIDSICNKTLNVSDAKISKVSIASASDKTHLIINENMILAPVISEDNEFIYITMNMPKETYDKIVIIDPGHGGKDPGAVNDTLFANEQILEKDIVLDIAQRLEQLSYKDNAFKVYLTRNEDFFVELKDRAGFSNELGDLFISIHVNSVAAQTAPNGIETFYYDSTVQNQKGIDSKKFAQIIQQYLIVYTEASDRGVKTAPFVVIKENEYPAILIETGFITNVNEVSKLIDNEYKQLIAEAVYRGLLETFNIYKPAR